MDTPTSLLDTLTDHWQAQGWPLDSLAAFHMEGEGAATPSIDSVLDAAEAAEPADTTATETATPDPGSREPGTPAVDPVTGAAAPATPAPAETFDRKYVEDLRAENARYRTERNQLQDTFGQAFDGYDPADRDTLLTVARMLRSDDPAERAEAGEWMRSQGEALAASAPAGDQPLTAAQVAAEVDRVLSQREQTKATADAQAARLAAINKEVTDLGLEPGSVDTQVVLSIALHETNGDIKAAHDKLVARDKAAVDRFLAGKEAEAANGSAVVPPTGGSAPAPTPIKDVKDASRHFESYLDSIGITK